ncbi:MAG: hypothetical protein J6J36_03940 [Clostridia bacterium]|nr:hypothetical protein [Clostridia bacterium]
MDIFSYVVAGLESKEFGEEKFYFDKYGCVVAVKYRENISYVIYVRKADCMFLVTETEEGYTIKTPIDMRKLFIIPEIDQRTDAELVLESVVEKDIAMEIPKSIFLIADYGFLENPMYKGCNFSRSKINVAVQNYHGKAFSISFEVGEGVYGCDENPNGNIPEAFSMNPIGFKNPDESLTIAI